MSCHKYLSQNEILDPLFFFTPTFLTQESVCKLKEALGSKSDIQQGAKAWFQSDLSQNLSDLFARSFTPSSWATIDEHALHTLGTLQLPLTQLGQALCDCMIRSLDRTIDLSLFKKANSLLTTLHSIPMLDPGTQACLDRTKRTCETLQKQAVIQQASLKRDSELAALNEKIAYEKTEVLAATLRLFDLVNTSLNPGFDSSEFIRFTSVAYGNTEHVDHLPLHILEALKSDLQQVSTKHALKAYPEDLVHNHFKLSLYKQKGSEDRFPILTHPCGLKFMAPHFTSEHTVESHFKSVTKALTGAQWDHLNSLQTEHRSAQAFAAEPSVNTEHVVSVPPKFECTEQASLHPDVVILDTLTGKTSRGKKPKEERDTINEKFVAFMATLQSIGCLITHEMYTIKEPKYSFSIVADGIAQCTSIEALEKALKELKNPPTAFHEVTFLSLAVSKWLAKDADTLRTAIQTRLDQCKARQAQELSYQLAVLTFAKSGIGQALKAPPHLEKLLFQELKDAIETPHYDKLTRVLDIYTLSQFNIPETLTKFEELLASKLLYQLREFSNAPLSKKVAIDALIKQYKTLHAYFFVCSDATQDRLSSEFYRNFGMKLSPHTPHHSVRSWVQLDQQLRECGLIKRDIDLTEFKTKARLFLHAPHLMNRIPAIPADLCDYFSEFNLTASSRSQQVAAVFLITLLAFGGMLAIYYLFASSHTDSPDHPTALTFPIPQIQFNGHIQTEGNHRLYSGHFTFKDQGYDLDASLQMTGSIKEANQLLTFCSGAIFYPPPKRTASFMVSKLALLNQLAIDRVELLQEMQLKDFKQNPKTGYRVRVHFKDSDAVFEGQVMISEKFILKTVPNQPGSLQSTFPKKLQLEGIFF